MCRSAEIPPSLSSFSSALSFLRWWFFFPKFDTWRFEDFRRARLLEQSACADMAAQPPWTRISACARCSGTVFSGRRRDVLRALFRSTPDIPDVLMLILHVVLLICSHLGNVLWARVTGNKNEVVLDSRGKPALLDEKTRRYPLMTTILALVMGAFVGNASLLRLAREPSAGVAMACACVGACIFMRRLLCWRQWVRDIVLEVFRVRELALVEQCAGDLGMPIEKVRILDFGAGKGTTAAHLLKYTGLQHVAAIDLEEHSPHVQAYDGVTIPFADSSFDLALAVYVFHHIPEKQPLFAQLQRTARRVLIFEDLPAETSHPLLAQLFFGMHFWGFKQPFHTHLDKSRTDWRRCLAQWGFVVLEEYDVAPTSFIPYRRVGFLLESPPAAAPKPPRGCDLSGTSSTVATERAGS